MWPATSSTWKKAVGALHGDHPVNVKPQVRARAVGRGPLNQDVGESVHDGLVVDERVRRVLGHRDQVEKRMGSGALRRKMEAELFRTLWYPQRGGEEEMRAQTVAASPLSTWSHQGSRASDRHPLGTPAIKCWAEAPPKGGGVF